MNVQALDLFAVVLAVMLGVVMPPVGAWDFRRLVRWIELGRPDARVRTYRWILAMEWGLVAVFVAWWLLDGRTWADMGFVPAAAGWQWLAIGLGLVATLLMIVQMVVVLRKPAQLRQVRATMGDLACLAPRDDREAGLFGAVAVTAGVCEEILYRGLLLTVLTPAIGVWAAVIVSSLIFGLGHVYQGWVGIGKTALVGLVMALLTVFGGSIFVPILLHAVIDLTSGRLMGEALKLEPEPEAAPY